MKVQLVLAGPYSSCRKTEKIWSEACLQHGLELEVLDLEHTNGEVLSRELDLTSYPALIADKSVKAVGNPDQDTANRLIKKLVSVTNQES